MNKVDKNRYDMYCKMLCQISNAPKVQAAYELQLLANGCKNYEKFARPEYPLVCLSLIAKGLSKNQSIDHNRHDNLIFYNLHFPDGRTFLKYDNVFYDPWNIPYVYDYKKRIISIDFTQPQINRNILTNLYIYF